MVLLNNQISFKGGSCWSLCYMQEATIMFVFSITLSKKIFVFLLFYSCNRAIFINIDIFIHIVQSAAELSIHMCHLSLLSQQRHKAEPA